ncbi:acid ceramidase-like [Haliotis rufescens]|uniref:acid ceramidase-like n=2 Tax=Haliotis TaxID=6452 RepID=UPI00201F2BD9|nr:acid ceramidase-like [Haliotis rufescens]
MASEREECERDVIRRLLDKFKSSLEQYGRDMKLLVDWVENNMGRLDERLPQPFAGEIAGIANATDMSLADAVLYNIFYELSTFCTSIVAEDSKGELYHARNMDFEFGEGYDIKNRTWFLSENLRPLLVNINYMRGGNLVFRAAHYAGYVGVVTGMKPKGFSVSENSRTGDGGGGVVGFLQWLLDMRNGTFTGFLTRTVLETAETYSEALTMLRSSPLLAPIYYILGGRTSGEGSVISRDKDDAIDVWPMASAGGWYVLETNYDHWVKPLFLDDRRGPANQCMRETTQQGVSLPALFNVLSTKPVLNKGTVYTALMHVESGHLETWIRECEDPCPPF